MGSVKKLKPNPKEELFALTDSCYLCGKDAADNLVGVIHDKFCDYDAAVLSGIECETLQPICTTCFVKTHGAVFAINALKKR